MSENNQKRDYYSFLEIVTAVNPKNGNHYKYAVTDGLLNKLTWRNRSDGQGRFLTASLAINKRTKTLEQALGVNLGGDSADVVWVDVVFAFDNVAERLMAYKEKRGLSNVLCSKICGSIYTKQDNQGKTRVCLTVSNWDANLSQKAGNASGGNAPAPAANMGQMGGFSGGYNNAPAAPAASYGGGFGNQFAELPEDDDDLPF